MYYIQYLHHTHLPPPPSHWYIPSPHQTGPISPSCSLTLYKKWRKRKAWHFCLLKIAAWGVSLWHFHIYMYYSLIWFISSIFLLSTLVPVLWWFQQVYKFYTHFCIECTSTIFTFLTSWNICFL
jgi:hypothetical protein